jgi:hyperosmotically inducible periplasmic protein
MRRACMLMLAGVLFGFGAARTARGDVLPSSQAMTAQSQIQTRLQGDADLRNNPIQATFDNGIVTLKGTVDSEDEKARAAGLAMVGGVTAIDNQLKVGSEGTKVAFEDTSITTRLSTEYIANVTDDSLRSVHVDTNNGVVTLSGSVPTEAAHRRALELAKTTSGVSRVEDHIKPPSFR